jgi:hypothetical protein
MRFLNRLRSLFEKFIRSRSGTNFELRPEADEELTRYIFSRSHFAATKNRVKPDAFLPSPAPVETSVFRMIGLNRNTIQEHGQKIGRERDQTLRAWADVRAAVVFDLQLDVRSDHAPPRHAAIVGWPLEKDEQISLAQQLAAAAHLHLPTSTS